MEIAVDQGSRQIGDFPESAVATVNERFKEACDLVFSPADPPQVTQGACGQLSKVLFIANRQTNVLPQLRQHGLQSAVHRRQPTSRGLPCTRIVYFLQRAPLHLFEKEPAAPAFVAGDPAIAGGSSQVHSSQDALVDADFVSRVPFRVGNGSVRPHGPRGILEDDAKMSPVVELQFQLLERGRGRMRRWNSCPTVDPLL